MLPASADEKQQMKTRKLIKVATVRQTKNTESVTEERNLTSLQRVLSDGLTEDAQACPGICSHLNLILGPDDELCDQTVVDLRAGDVLLLVLSREPRKPVPASGQSMAKQ